MSRAGFCQLVCVVLLAVFIFFSLSGEKEVTLSAGEIAESITSVMDTENLISFDEVRLEEEFGFKADSFDSFLYMGNEDIMDVREILIIKLKDGADEKAVISAIEKRAEEKYNTFRDYDAVAADILESRVTQSKNGFIFYCAHSDSRQGAQAFLKSTDSR